MTITQNINVFSDIDKPIIAIMGATATGKTDLACRIYDENPQGYDIISVDSALIYRDMNIGTAKPTKEELKQYPHALVDIIDPTQTYSAADFAQDARDLIKMSHDNGKTPILVGGTMLYFKALFGGLDNIPASQPEVREKLSQQLVEQGILKLYERLQHVDEQTATRLNSTDTQRILRALEVYEISGQPLSSFHTHTQVQLPDTWRLYGINPDRQLLHKRIEQRLEKMWQNGFLDEVQGLLTKYQLSSDNNAMRAVGYRQVVEFLYSKQTKEDRQEMQNKALFATRQLAKRQTTWLRKFENLYKIETFQSHSINLKNLM